MSNKFITHYLPNNFYSNSTCKIQCLESKNSSKFSFFSPLIIKNFFILFTVSILFFTVGISNQDAFASIDMFLKIDDVKGESKDVEHLDEIEVLAWSWGLTQSGTTHTGAGGGAGKVSVQDISVTKYTDKSTPELLASVATGDVFQEGKLTLRKAGETPIEFETIIMKKILVSSVSMGGSAGEDRLTENITLNFEEFEVKYTEQQSDGSAGDIETFSWNIAKNTGGGNSGGGGTDPPDTDGDEVADTLDNCPTDFNPSQINSDFDDLGDACDTDDDNDGIPDTLDTETAIPPTVLDFTDGTTFGSIISGNDFLTITDVANGVNISSTGDATIDVCGISTLSLSADDVVDLECGSVIIQVISGSVQLQSPNEPEITLNEGANITIEDTFEITNNGPLAIILVNDVERLISSGATIVLGTSDPPDSVLTQILNQIQAILASILGLDERVSELENKIVVFEELFTGPALEKSNKAQDKADNAQQKADETGKEKDQKKADKEQSKACDKIQKEIGKLEDKGLSLPTELQQLLSDKCS